jgi:Aerotolerance regulator N-terminal
MTWLAPWALGAGALGILGVIAAHLLTRQRPRALALATARFLPAGMLEATTLQRIPVDRWWMLLRLMVVALLALGAAQPVATVSRVPTRTVLLLDQTLPLGAQQRVLATLTATDAVIAFDTSATIGTSALLSLRVSKRASLSAAFAQLARARDSLARGATQLRVAIASPLSPRSLDPATQSLRQLTPDSISVLPVLLPPDSAVARGRVTVHADGDDAIAATAQLLGDSIVAAGTIIQRGALLTRDDSSAARSGAAVLWWPARMMTGTAVQQALTVGSTTWIAPMSRETNAAPTSAPASARVVGWWADGTPAIHATQLGNGCLLQLHASLPNAGDQTLSLSAQAWLGALLTSCDREPLLKAPTPMWLAAPARQRTTVDARPIETSSLSPWLIGAALALAAAELLLRQRRQS